MANPNLLNEEVGLLCRGWIDSYDPTRDIIRVKLNHAASTSANKPVDVSAPYPLFYNNGLFIGTKPAVGTPVIVGCGSGGKYYFVSFLAENLDLLPELVAGELLLQSNGTTKISLDNKNNISLGSDNSKVHINTSDNYISTNFNNQYNFTQASRRIEGIVRREAFNNYVSEIDDDSYESITAAKKRVISLDPFASSTTVISSSSKNPPFVEQREMIYEFQYSSQVNDDLNESLLYSDATRPSNSFTFPNRRKSRADTLSLTLFSPNYLMETVKGTVVDIFGNILDLNRSVLPIGQDQNTLRADKSTDKTASFLKIKELERKSLAYHFEINARKDLSGQNGKIILPDINSNDDYSRSRSRFFLDIDKEGQFKLNVPASSEKGNVPLLTRYENYSTFGPDDNNNPNKLIFREDNLDIFQDSFAAPKSELIDSGFSLSMSERGSIEIKDGDVSGTPLDRIMSTEEDNVHIKHGTAYHDILKTCYAHQSNALLNYQAGEIGPLTVDLDSIITIDKIASDTIQISGDNANAGGRSGSINFDGSIELNVGANTVDRQSIWLDTAGALVANIGRDLQNMSTALSMNGDCFIQVGGIGVSGDSRFVKQNNGVIGAVLDLRVLTAGGYANIIRIDKNGITIMTPGNLAIHSSGSIKMTADTDINIECANLTLQKRLVRKESGGSI